MLGLLKMKNPLQINTFEKSVLIELEGKNIVIRDRTGLSRMSDFYGK